MNTNLQKALDVAPIFFLLLVVLLVSIGHRLKKRKPDLGGKIEISPLVPYKREEELGEDTLPLEL